MPPITLDVSLVVSSCSSFFCPLISICKCCWQDEDFVAENEDDGSPTDDSGGDDSDGSDSGGE